MSLSFFDANVVVGAPRNGALYGTVAAPAALAEYVTAHGLRGALIWHWAQLESHPATGNDLLRPYLRVPAEVYPCWTLLPPLTEEPLGLPGPLPEALPGAVRLFPGAHRYLTERVVWGGLLDELAARRVPVLLSLEHEVTWQQVYALLRDCPALTCVLCDIGTWSMDRYTYPLLDAYANVCVETSMLSLEDGGLEAMVRRFGAARVVFGTGFPKRYATAAMLQLTHADIAAPDRQAIAADNMLRLLKETIHG